MCWRCRFIEDALSPNKTIDTHRGRRIQIWHQAPSRWQIRAASRFWHNAFKIELISGQHVDGIAVVVSYIALTLHGTCKNPRKRARPPRNGGPDSE